MSKASFISVDPENVTQAERHSFLLSAIAPRPIALASTISAKGDINLSPFSFFNVFSSNPPIVVFSPARNARNLSLKHTLENLYEIPETVINIVNYPMVEQMSLSSTAYDKGVNEFKKSGLTELPSQIVRPPRVQQSPASFECLVEEIKELGQGPGAGHLVIARVVMMHFAKEYLKEDGKLDPTQLDQVGRMGGAWYTRANKDNLFSIPKPLRSQGIGVDSLPAHVRNSRILTGNNLGRLGNLEKMPSKEEILLAQQRPEFNSFIDPSKDLSLQIETIHTFAAQCIKEDKEAFALAILMTIEDK